jgi:plasmid stabilization system protein ParE
MSRFILSAEARADVREIKNYIAEDSIDTARRVVAEFRKAFRDLAKTPGMGHSRADLTKRPVLFWPVYSYLIIYRPGQPLEIIAVLHGKRNLKRILRGRL